MDKSATCRVRKARYADNANMRNAGNKVTLSMIEAMEEMTTLKSFNFLHKQTIFCRHHKEAQKAR